MKNTEGESTEHWPVKLKENIDMSVYFNYNIMDIILFKLNNSLRRRWVYLNTAETQLQLQWGAEMYTELSFGIRFHFLTKTDVCFFFLHTSNVK